MWAGFSAMVIVAGLCGGWGMAATGLGGAGGGGAGAGESEFVIGDLRFAIAPAAAGDATGAASGGAALAGLAPALSVDSRLGASGLDLAASGLLT